MYELLILLLPVGVAASSLLAVLGLAGVLHFTSRRQDGWLHYCIYGVLLGVATMVLTSGRDISNGSDAGYAAQAAGLSSIATWVIRLTSFAFVLLSAERILSHVLRSNSMRHGGSSPPGLLPAFCAFWLCTAFIPTFFAAHPTSFRHDSVYLLLIGSAYIFSSHKSSVDALKAARNGITLLCVTGLVVAAVKPGLVLDFNYQQGLISGMPRLAGLTPHAVSYGFIVQIGIFCVWYSPYEKKWLNALAMLTLIASLILAQSKTAWSSTMVCALILCALNYRVTLSKAILDSQRPALGIALVASLLIALTSGTLFLLFHNIDGALASFLASDEGANLASFTGRDQIWQVALTEWSRNPILGYGNSLFDADYRTLIGMSAATHAHNQVIDTLARSGVVGAAALIFYMSVLLYWSIYYARATRALTVLLCLSIFLRCVSEIPFITTGYGVDFVAHALLLAIISGTHRHQALSRAVI